MFGKSRRQLTVYNDHIPTSTYCSIALFLLITLSFSSMIQGQSFQDTPIHGVVEKLERYLMSAKDAYKLNGSILVAQHGKVLVQRGYGWSDIELKKLNRATTIFPILSITKPITAVVVLKLQEEKKLSVRDKLSRYFPDFPNANKITIHHLLTHSSGLHNYSDYVGIEDSLLTNYPMPKERMLEYIQGKPADFAPGKYYRYNNSGYYLLGLIIEEVTGKPYETVVREMIFHPLKMKHSGFDFNSLPDSLTAKGYQFLDAERAVRFKHFDSTYAYSAGRFTAMLEICTNGLDRLPRSRFFHQFRGEKQ